MVLDADLRDFFGNVQHELLINKIAERVSDGRVLRLIRQMLEAGYMEKKETCNDSRYAARWCN